MSTFRVHGVTEAAAKHKSRHKLGGASPQRDEQIVQETYQKMKPVQISEPFDAPQFCQAFIELAKRTMKCRALSVYVYADKVNKHGAPITSKRTGKPLKAWVPFQG